MKELIMLIFVVAVVATYPKEAVAVAQMGYALITTAVGFGIAKILAFV